MVSDNGCVADRRRKAKNKWRWINEYESHSIKQNWQVLQFDQSSEDTNRQAVAGNVIAVETPEHQWSKKDKEKKKVTRRLQSYSHVAFSNTDSEVSFSSIWLWSKVLQVNP